MTLYDIMSVNSHMADTLNNELSAMQQVALALAQLDEPTRLRVLHWAIERFQLDVSAVARTPPQPAAPASPAGDATQADEGLSVSTLEELFTPSPREAGAAAAAADQPARKDASGIDRKSTRLNSSH